MALNINGTTGISGVDGSASAPALQGTDSNTGINFASDTVNINTGGVTRATVDSNGRLGIGTSSPSYPLDVSTSSGKSSLQIITSGTGANDDVFLRMRIGGNTQDCWIDFGDSDDQDAGYIRYNHSNNFMSFATSASERMRIDSSGDLRVQRIYDNITSGGANVRVQSDGLLQRDTSSKRYKNTITDATHGLADLNKLRSVTYKGNNDGDTIIGGLIAEEVHDAGLTEFVDYDSDNQPDALKYGNMVSLCIKAIQELSAKVETLETEKTQMQTDLTALTARVAALEAG